MGSEQIGDLTLEVRVLAVTGDRQLVALAWMPLAVSPGPQVLDDVSPRILERDDDGNIQVLLLGHPTHVNEKVRARGLTEDAAGTLLTNARSYTRPSVLVRQEVVVTGGAGFLGRPTVKMLEDLGAEVTVTRSAEHDLRERTASLDALEGAQVVIHLAANVGGIGYNRRNPGPLAHDNLAMGLNMFEACRELEVEKLVAACSVCAYPKFTPVPFTEDEIWNGYPEESNAPYGLAKKMLIVLSDAYRRQYGLDSCAPVMANLYGPGDNFDLEDSHVIAAMIHKYVAAAASGRAGGGPLGDGRALPRVPLRGRCGPGADPRSRAARQLRAGQHRHRAGDPDPRPRGDDLRALPASRARPSGTPPAGRPAQALPGRGASAGADWASRRRRRWRRACARTIESFRRPSWPGRSAPA